MTNEQLTTRYRLLDRQWHDLTRQSLEAQAARDFDAAAAYDKRRWKVLDEERALIERHGPVTQESN